MSPPKFRLEGLLKRTGEWMHIHIYDDIEDARDEKTRLRYMDDGWVDAPDYSVRIEEFAAWRIQCVYTVRWIMDDAFPGHYAMKGC